MEKMQDVKMCVQGICVFPEYEHFVEINPPLPSFLDKWTTLEGREELNKFSTCFFLKTCGYKDEEGSHFSVYLTDPNEKKKIYL